MLPVAAVLLVVIGCAHSYLGERYILIRLIRRTDLPKLFGSDEFTRRTLRFAWHITTIAWFGFAALLVASARAEEPAVSTSTIGTTIAVTFLASGLVSLTGSRGRHLSWIVFLALAALAWLGSR